MHGNSDRDLIQTLNSMANEALQRNYGDRPAARAQMEQAIRNDRRFDWADARVLAQQYERARASCAVLKLDDPRLKGQPARPLERDRSW
jgi:hypothetical protein